MKRAVVFMLLAFGAWPAAARDMLPLKRGIYVDAAMPCRGAGRASTMSYWGDDNGINVAQVVCRIEQLSRKDDVFTLQRTCRPISGERTYKDLLRLRLVGQSAFQIDDDTSAVPSGPLYRYCGPKAEF